ncbi:cytochrome [Bacillus safensis FO-36b] [Bacillus safensis subsp. safensis]
MKVKENYVNVIPMKEIRSTDDLLFHSLFTMSCVQRVILDMMTRKCWDLFRYADISLF